MLTVPVYERLDQLTTIQFVVVVRVMHFEVVKLQLCLGHLTRINRHLHVLLNVTVEETQQNINK